MWGCFVWGECWRGGVICWNCDNLTVVEVITRGSSKDGHLSHIPRCIHFAEAKYNFTLVANHVAGVDNDKADDLSRNQLSSFLSKVPEAGSYPTVVPQRLKQLGWVDQQNLGQVVERLLRESLAPSTRRTYCAAQGRYLTFCAEENTLPVPTNEEILCKFVAWIFVRDLAYQTMKSYLSAVCHLQIMSSLGDPFVSEMPRLQYVLKG